MSENEVMTTYGVEEDEPILPSGWNEGDDFFQSDSWSGDSDSADGHSSDTEQDEDSTEVNADDDDLPTTEEPDTENSQSAGDDQNAAGPDGAAEQQEAAPKTYRLRVNHEDKDVCKTSGGTACLHQREDPCARPGRCAASHAPGL